MADLPGRGRVEAITGPMFSGKTDALIRRLAAAEEQGLRVCALKPVLDSRSGDSVVVSHSGLVRRATGIRRADDVHERGSGYDVVGIDEVQFLAESICEAAALLRSRGVRVVAAGLDLDFLRRPFVSTERLVGVADEHEARTARCGRCGAEATLTQRLLGGAPAPADDPRVRVGAAELYEPRCVPCYEAEDRMRPASSPAAVRPTLR